MSNGRWLSSLALALLCLWPAIVRSDDLVEKISQSGELKTLSAAIQAADLTRTLKGAGPFTLFAPTDEAFAALPEEKLKSLLLPDNKDQLIRILTQHVVPGRLTVMQVGNINVPQMVRTVNGRRIPIGIEKGDFRIGDAKVMSREIPCSNGVVHVIDKVLIPEELRTEEAIKIAVKEAAPASLLDALRAVPDSRFSTFLAAVQASGGDQDWAQPEPSGNWTLFVPTNAAFNRLSDAERNALLDPQNRETLRELLAWHALPKLQPWSFEFSDGERAAVMVSRQNDRFVLDVLSSGLVFVYQLRSADLDRDSEEPFKARILAGDIQVGGSLVNVVDRVIVPRQLEGKLLASQAYLEKDVAEFNAAAEARDIARGAMRNMLEKASQLDSKGQMAMYEMGLQMMEEVLPVSRNGVILDRADMSKPEVVRERLRTRVDDLDRVWYGNFMQNSPAGRSLAEPLPEFYSAPRLAKPVEASNKASSNVATLNATLKSSPDRSVTSAVPSPAPSASSATTSDLSWCEVLEREVDEKEVTDEALRAAITATGLPWRVRDKASGIELLLVPSSQFEMGRTLGDKEDQANEVPSHPVTLSKAFYLGRYEVTREQWLRVMKGEPKSPPPRGGAAVAVQGPQGGSIIIQPSAEFRKQDGTIIKGEAAVEQTGNGGIIVTLSPAQTDVEANAAGKNDPKLPILVGWSQCDEFCRKAGMRLPSEAEWEFACRGGVSAPRYGKLDEIAWHRGNADGKNHPVGTKAANALGFHDMIGNAWEWVNDWYSEYTRAPQTDPTGPASGTARIIRGGYFDFEQGFCRASLRYSIDSPDFGNSTGFRVARNP